MGALYQPGDSLEDDFGPWLEDEEPWITKIYQLCPNDENVISHFLTDDELYQVLAFPDDYDWSTTVIFKFDVDCPEVWPDLLKYMDHSPELKFGGWARTKVAYVHIIKTSTVDEADILLDKREMVIGGAHCYVLPVRVVS